MQARHAANSVFAAGIARVGNNGGGSSPLRFGISVRLGWRATGNSAHVAPIRAARPTAAKTNASLRFPPVADIPFYSGFSDGSRWSSMIHSS